MRTRRSFLLSRTFVTVHLMYIHGIRYFTHHRHTHMMYTHSVFFSHTPSSQHTLSINTTFILSLIKHLHRRRTHAIDTQRSFSLTHIFVHARMMNISGVHSFSRTPFSPYTWYIRVYIRCTRYVHYFTHPHHTHLIYIHNILTLTNLFHTHMMYTRNFISPAHPRHKHTMYICDALTHTLYTRTHTSNTHIVLYDGVYTYDSMFTHIITYHYMITHIIRNFFRRRGPPTPPLPFLASFFSWKTR